MDTAEDFCLRWNDHHKLIWGTMERLLGNQNMTDVTLSLYNGQNFKAHRLVLSACSPYFEGNSIPGTSHKHHPHGINPFHMQLLLQYMYRGEVNVEESEILSLLAAAKDLQIRGLTEAAENICHRQKVKEEVKDYEVVEQDNVSMNDNSLSENVDPANVDTNSCLLKSSSSEERDSPPVSINVPSKSCKSIVKKSTSPGGSDNVCVECGKVFSHRWMLERHSTTHSGIQRFVCSICERKFSHQASAARHIKNVHKEKNTHYLINKLEGSTIRTKVEEVFQND
ncbi:unnamed protein product [Lepeophtheirus salmonis]|uniref:(salmon louse) hypothetical protein n=1 Tax=Lepeophtheirus salmonis TaxID=72036 RepID=A0A7R8D2Q4_LEPSM|nr:unnamed protein product [Lepeophtheirus salmonis]CAF2958268.1 unnamed protein product [Lepeophtheirus salmonis]